MKDTHPLTPAECYSRGIDYDMTARTEELRQLGNIILIYGDKFAKRHGHWVRLRLNDNWYFQMDSWNCSIHLKQGTGEPNTGFPGDVCGFVGVEVQFIGSLWGPISSPLDRNQIRSFVNRAKNWLNYMHDLYHESLPVESMHFHRISDSLLSKIMKHSGEGRQNS